MSHEPDSILVEFFGPFRAYGSALTMPASEAMSFTGLIERLEGLLGDAFKQRALGANTTCILNNDIVNRDASGDALVNPGDRVAFALLLDGG